jgi:hypothetical protein
MSDKCPVRLRVVFVALALVITIIVSSPLPASAGSYESCLGSCAIGSFANSPECMSRRAECSIPSSPQMESFGAIAYSVSTNNVGYSNDASSAKEAERIALSYCSEDKGADDCKLEAQFENRCGAIAWGDDEIIRWGIDMNKSLAESAALMSCKGHGGKNCEAIASHCSLR